MSHRIVFSLRWILLLLLSCRAATALPDALEREQKIKAAYLYHLAQFIDWPDKHALKTSPNITICHFGDSNFAGQLQNLEQRKIKGREIHLTIVDAKGINPQCNILFAEGQSQPNHALLEKYADNGTITVGEKSDFIDGGGLIALTTVENHVRLLINFEKARANGLYVSANLLEVATIVSPSASGR